MRRSIAVVLIASIAGIPLLICERKVKHEERTKTNPDSTVQKDVKSERVRPDGTVIKEEEHKTDDHK